MELGVIVAGFVLIGLMLQHHHDKVTSQLNDIRKTVAQFSSSPAEDSDEDILLRN